MKNKINNHIIITLTLLFLSIPNSKAQDNQVPDLLNKRNSIYSNFGIGFLSISVMAYYERFIKKQERFTSFYKIGIGATTTFFDGDFHLLGQYGILTGGKKHHLELGIGPNIEIENLFSLRRFLPLTSTIGWRIQKPDGNFIFRTGLSWPEGAYIGFGVSF